MGEPKWWMVRDPWAEAACCGRQCAFPCGPDCCCVVSQAGCGRAGETVLSVCSVLGPGVSSSPGSSDERRGKAAKAAKAAAAVAAAAVAVAGCICFSTNMCLSTKHVATASPLGRWGCRQGDGRSNGAEAGRRTELQDSDHRARGQGDSAKVGEVWLGGALCSLSGGQVAGQAGPRSI